MPRRPLVVLVEDDAGVARAIERSLRALGLAVETHSTGEAALERVQRAPAPHVVWCDFDLGTGPTGAEVLRAAAAALPSAILLHVSSTELDDGTELPARTLRFSKAQIDAATTAVSQSIGMSGVRSKPGPRARKRSSDA